MGKGLPRSLAHAPRASAPSVKQTLSINKNISVAGATGVGWGTAVIAGLPAGNILLLGLVCYMQFSTNAAGVTSTFTGNVALGTAPATSASISGSQVDLFASTALGAATGKLSPLVRATNATQVIIDNTNGDLEVNLNLLIDDASISADSTFTARGSLSIAYIVLGDD